MKIAFLTSDKIHEKVRNIVFREFEEIKLTVYKYDKYDDVIEILKNNETKFDAIVFAGYIPYHKAIMNVKRTIPWYYMTIKESCIKGTLLKALSLGYKIDNISYDADKSSIEEIYNELEIEYENIYVKYEEIDLEDSNYTNKDIEDKINEIFSFHRNLYINKSVKYSLTSVSEVANMLSKEKIPYSFVKVSNDAIRGLFTNIYLKYIAAKNQNSQVVTVAITIDIPNEYSINKDDEYSLILEKEKIEQEVYKFAYKIKAAVVQTPTYGYLIFSTKKILESETDYFNKIELINNIEKNSIRTVSVGIGYGESALSSKYNAYKGLNRSQKDSNNSIYIVYEDESINGPIYSRGNVDKCESSEIDEKLLHIAIKSQLSINTISTIYEISNKLKKDTFTSKELANLYGISSRGINRILLKLEDSGFIEVVGRKVNSQLGRPSRIIKLKF